MEDLCINCIFSSVRSSLCNHGPEHTYRNQMSSYAKRILNDVIKLLTEFCDVGLAATTDIWSSRTQDSYISLTAHFVDKHFRLHRYNFNYCHHF